MKIRAVIFDLYNTLLEVGPPSADAKECWTRLWKKHLGSEPRLALREFSARADAVIARQHAAAKAAGISHPEIFWPDVAREVIPELASLSEAQRDEFFHEQTCLWHTTRLMPGAGDFLSELRRRPVLLGLASNSQPYTLRELDAALANVNLTRGLFQPDLCFFSFAHGFSKPDPHVFRLLAARLTVRAISAAETLMVGDRLDNDIEPARAQGWRTWLLATPGGASGAQGGNWHALAAWLRASGTA